MSCRISENSTRDSEAMWNEVFWISTPHLPTCSWDCVQVSFSASKNRGAVLISRANPTGSSAGLRGRQGGPGYCKHCAVRGNKLGKGLFLVKMGVTAPRISSHLTRKIPMDFNQGTRKWASRNILCLLPTCLKTPAQSLSLIMMQRKDYLCLKTYNVPFVY